MNGGPGRLEALAALLLLAGAVMATRSAWRLLHAARAKLTYGAPYRRGQVADRLTAFLMTVPVLLAGALLGILAAAQAAFQPDETTIRVGQVVAHRAGWGKVAVRFVPDAGYPAAGILEGEVEGGLWAIGGDFIEWDKSVRWLGLRPGHRLRYLLGAKDGSGLGRAALGTTVLEPLPRAAALLVRAAPRLPFVRVARATSPWFRPADRTVMVLYATGAGYLADSVAEGRANSGAGGLVGDPAARGAAATARLAARAPR